MKLITDHTQIPTENNNTFYGVYVSQDMNYRSLLVMAFSPPYIDSNGDTQPASPFGAVKYAYQKSKDTYSERSATWIRCVTNEDVLYELTDQEAFTLLLINTI